MPGQLGNKGGGRKTKPVEVSIVRYYEDLLPKVFIEVRNMLETGTKKQKLWAMEYLKTGFVKLIPQKVGGDKDNPFQFKQIYGGQSRKQLQGQSGNQKDISIIS